MDTKTELKLIESFNGKGKVYNGEQFIADVNYSIKEIEEALNVELSEGRASREVEQRTICGIVESTQVELLYSYLGARLTLHFQDGRVLDFAVTDKLSGNNCLIKNLGAFKMDQPNMIPGTPLPLWENDVEFQAIRTRMEGHTLVGVNDSYIIYQFALHTRSLPGDSAEVGVYKGGTAMLLAKAFEATGKNVHLFDTFGGMPPTDSSRDRHKQGDFDDVTYEEVKEYMSDCPHAHLYKGFFPNTAGPVEEKTFCLVHVDVDIYQSVLDCCRFFYPRLTSGGVMIFDDYGRWSCPGAKAAVDEFFADKAEHPIYSGHSHSAQAFVVKI